ncbi:hypothetical protein AX16_010069 [Volvariella volvacea WC 439]|nr:hypothetical protein AX16_010069 [Volvariella volvacea WC 439]
MTSTVSTLHHRSGPPLHLLPTPQEAALTRTRPRPRDLGGEGKYLEFLAAPAPSLDLFNPDSLSQTTSVHGTITLSLTGPAAIARLTAHTEDGHHGSGLNSSGAKDPNVIDYEGTLYYDSWEQLESAPNDVELQAGRSIPIRFTVEERLVGVVRATSATVVPVVFVLKGSGFQWSG